MAAAAARGPRSHPRPRQPASEGSRPGPVAAVRRRAGDRTARWPTTPRCPTRRPWSETEALGFEKEALGLYMSGHPLQRYAAVLDVGRREAPGGPDRSRTPTARSAASSPACVRSRPSGATGWPCSCSRKKPPRSRRSSFRRRSRSAAALDRRRRDAARAREVRARRRDRAGSSSPRSRCSTWSATARCAKSRSGWQGTGLGEDAMRALVGRARALPRRSPRARCVVEVNGGQRAARARRHRPPHQAERPASCARSRRCAGWGRVVLK